MAIAVPRYSSMDLTDPNRLKIPQFQVGPVYSTDQGLNESGAPAPDYGTPSASTPAPTGNLYAAPGSPANLAGIPSNPNYNYGAPGSTGGATTSVNWNTPPAPKNGGAYGPDEISSFLSYYAGQAGINPSVGGDPGYWTRRIAETGGLRPDNVQYWVGLMRRPEGAPEGGSSLPANLQGFTAGASPAIAAKGYTEDPRGSALFDQLVARAQQGLTVNANDPNIRQQTDAYRNEQTRNMRNYLSAAAERGGPTANQDAIRRSASEKVGQDVSGFEAQLIGQEVAARRAEIQSALAGEQGYLSSQQQAELQDELARLSLMEQQYQFQTSTGAAESQFARDLAQRGFESSSNYALRSQGL